MIQDLDGEHGNQADQRTDAEFMKLAIGVAQDIVKESFFFVPQCVLAAAHVLHGAADVDKVLEELNGQSFVNFVALGQLEAMRMR